MAYPENTPLKGTHWFGAIVKMIFGNCIMSDHLIIDTGAASFKSEKKSDAVKCLENAVIPHPIGLYQVRPHSYITIENRI
ncbi:hypothetical protein GDO78_022717 [Eleutherodactylus coqui]|uniref:Uncharacterized protein n=1 Tax=Eleutherodactylus coqui TaxID=57060 RepID=A0A8J6ELS7_ELECQ|nr:hypothetical protein GDO78_022717 [Eleutherodactylus coqui]